MEAQAIFMQSINTELVSVIQKLRDEVKQMKNELKEMKLSHAALQISTRKILTKDDNVWLTKKEFVQLLNAMEVLGAAAGKSRMQGSDIRFLTAKIREDQPFTSHKGEGKPPRGTAMWQKSERICYFHRTFAFNQFVEHYVQGK